MLTIRLLGNFTLSHHGATLTTFNGSPRVQGLLAYLLLRRDAPQPRQQIAFLFWPESTETQARTNLRKLLLQLRRALPDAASYLLDTQQTVQWRPDAPFWLDVAEVQRLLAQLQAHGTDQALLTQLADLYTGELLPGSYEEWIYPLRQALHEAVTQALAQLVQQLEATHAYQEGVRYAQRLLHLDPLEEQTYLRLMRLRALTGDRTGALQTYHDCVATLRRELDVEPIAAIQTLAKQLQSGLLPPEMTPRVARHAPGTAAKPQPPFKGVRLPTTPCFGRATELQRLTERLATADCRLLTLYGPGGIGKTRLALALAEALRPRFPQGVAFVALAPLQRAEMVAPAIANALDLLLVEGRRPEIQLLAHLQDQQLLLLLDNAEHLLQDGDEAGGAALPDGGTTPSARGTTSVPVFIEALLDAAPKLKILVTSREPLALYEEHTFALQGLAVGPPPAGGGAPPVDKERAGVARGQQDAPPAISAAERLFYHQLARVRPELDLTTLSPADQATIAQICQVVEGMPLALELAATQLRTLSPTDLLAAIQQTVDTLQVRWRGTHQRHQSMRAVIDRSVATLDEADRLALARLAIFQGSFTPTSAQVVAQAPLEMLDRLLHKSLLRRAIAHGLAQQQEPLPPHRQAGQRFELHTLIRQYGSALLEQAPAALTATADRYYHYHATQLAESMARARTGAQNLAEIGELGAELANLNAVAQWLLAHGSAQERQRYLADLWDLYRLERRLPEIIALLNDAIAATAHGATAAEAASRAQWHRMLGEAYHILGEFDESRRHFEATLHALHFPLPGSNLELLTMLQRQGLQQVINRLDQLKLFRRRSSDLDAQPGLLDAIEAYRQLVDISLFSGDLMRLVNSALYALNLAERTNEPAALALTYGLMALMTGVVPGIHLGEIYEKLAVKQLPLVKTPERQIDIAIYLSAYDAGQGHWAKLDALLAEAIAQSQELHAYRRWGYCQAIWASTFIYRGQFAKGLQAWRALYEQSLISDSFLFILPAWAAGGMALCHVRLGAWQQAIKCAQEGLRHLQGKDDAIGRARCHAAMALAHLMGHGYHAAHSAADMAMAQLHGKRPTNYAALECYAWVVELYLALWQRVDADASDVLQQTVASCQGEIGQPLTPKGLQAKAHRALKALQSYAQVFPIGRPSAALAQGDYAWRRGRPALAYASWRQCIEVASATAMPHEAGRAHQRLACYLPMAEAAREQHRRLGEAIFAELHLSRPGD